MAEQKTLDRLREIRMARLRLGQAVADIHTIPSLKDENEQVALIPLLESEYNQAFERSRAKGEDSDGRHMDREVLVMAIREPENLEERIFSNVKEMMELLEVTDVNFLSEQYMLLVDRVSPNIGSFNNEQVEFLKDFLGKIDLSGLSGTQCTRLMYFLSSLSPEQLLGNSFGFTSMNPLIGMSKNEKSAQSVSPS